MSESGLQGRRRRLRALAYGVSIASMAGALSWTAPALAAGQAANQGNTVGEVVVTAQFRAQSLQKTPVAITAVNAQMLEQRSQTDISQVANQAPNVILKPMGGAFGPSMGASIRGVGQYDFNPALEPGVGIYVDDVYYPQLTGSIFDLLDLDRVEILRGPQGTLAGKNSIGGAIKLFSKKPTGDNGGYVEGTYGSLNRIDVRASADFTLVKDKLFMRISGVTKHQDGYITRLDFACANPNDPAVTGHLLPSNIGAGSCVLGHQGGKDYNAIRAMLRWVPSDRVEVNLIGDFTSDNSEPGGQTLLAAKPLQPWITAIYGVPYDSRFVPSNPYVNYSTFSAPGGVIGGIPTLPLTAEDKSRLSGWGVSGMIDWKIADAVSLKSITAFRGFTTDWAEDNDQSPLPLSVGIEHESHQQFSQEVRFDGKLFNAVDWTVGGYYFRQKTYYATHQDLIYASPVLDFLGNDPVLAHTEAGFAQADWGVTDKLHLIGGVRYTAEDKDYTYIRVERDGVTPAPLVGGVNGVTGHYSGSKWDWRAVAQYQWTPEFMTYAQFSTGFKGGGVNPRPFFGPAPFCPTAHPTCQVQSFGPETLDAYELGFKSDLFDRRLRLNVSAFYNEYNGIQLTLLNCPDFSPPGLGFLCAMPVNAGDAHVKGAEAEAEVHPVDGMTLDGSVSYLDFKYTKLDPATGILLTDKTPLTPTWKWSLGAQYEFPLGGLGSLTPRIDGSYQSSTYTNALNASTNLINGYTVFNARLTWRSPERDLQASLEVTNFTNELYYLNKFDLYNSAGFIYGTPAMPREWAVTIKKTF